MREALAHAPDFPPAILLWYGDHRDVSLQCFFRLGHELNFRLLDLQNHGMSITVEVEHAVANRKLATRDRFILHRSMGDLFDCDQKKCCRIFANQQALFLVVCGQCFRQPCPSCRASGCGRTRAQPRCPSPRSQTPCDLSLLVEYLLIR